MCIVWVLGECNDGSSKQVMIVTVEGGEQDENHRYSEAVIYSWVSILDEDAIPCRVLISQATWTGCLSHTMASTLSTHLGWICHPMQGTDFTSDMDRLFKSYYVFNLEYHSPLFAFYVFLERCVFGIEATSKVPVCVWEMDAVLTAIASRSSDAGHCPRARENCWQVVTPPELSSLPDRVCTQIWERKFIDLSQVYSYPARIFSLSWGGGQSCSHFPRVHGEGKRVQVIAGTMDESISSVNVGFIMQRANNYEQGRLASIWRGLSLFALFAGMGVGLYELWLQSSRSSRRWSNAISKQRPGPASTHQSLL